MKQLGTLLLVFLFSLPALAEIGSAPYNPGGHFGGHPYTSTFFNPNNPGLCFNQCLGAGNPYSFCMSACGQLNGTGGGNNFGNGFGNFFGGARGAQGQMSPTQLCQQHDGTHLLPPVNGAPSPGGCEANEGFKTLGLVGGNVLCCQHGPTHQQNLARRAATGQQGNSANSNLPRCDYTAATACVTQGNPAQFCVQLLPPHCRNI